VANAQLEVAGGVVAAALPGLVEAVQAGRIGGLVLVRYSVRLVAPGARTNGNHLAAVGRHAAAVVVALSGAPPSWAFAQRLTIWPARQANYLAGHFQLPDGAFATLEAHVGPPDAFRPWEQLLVVGTKGIVRVGSDWGPKVLLHDEGGASALFEVKPGELGFAARAAEADWPRFPGVSRPVVEGVLAQLSEPGGEERHGR